MTKLYLRNVLLNKQPKTETIQYLLNYSKQLRVVKTNKTQHIELHLN